MPNADKKERTSIVATFTNHPPIRFWGGPECKYLDDFISTLWDGLRDFGHHTIDYYECKAGKRIYYASYNSGESYGSHSPQTRRTFLRDKDAIKNYLVDCDREDEWYRICGKVDPTLILDSDLL